MKSCYVIDGWIFTKIKEDSDGTCYFRITHPDGRVLDTNHIFSSEYEMITYLKTK